MSILTHPNRPKFLPFATDASGAVRSAIAILVVTTVVIVMLAPISLVLPTLAFVAAACATASGIIGWLSDEPRRQQAFLIASAFAFAAAAAAMLGDPDQIARFMR